MKQILIILLVLAIAGCSTKEIIYQNQTYYNTTVIETVCSPCDCACTPTACPKAICAETTCDKSELLKCRLESARLIGTVDYYKETLSDYLMNDTIEGLEANLTKCLSDLSELNETLEDIRNSLTEED